MNAGFINRLVGTTIVVVAAIVFIPNILDGEKVHYKEGFKAIPERPEFTTIDLQEAIDNKVSSAEQPSQISVEDIQANDTELVTNETQQIDDAPKMVEASTDEPVITKAEPKVVVQEPAKPIAKTPEPTRKPEENLTQMAYVIQLGSFSHAPNVKSLQEKLKANGFKTFTRPVKTPNGTLTKVFVGPSLSKKELESKLTELKQLTKLNGKVTQFEITK
ncbi:SPOR domain-containing protein [Pseudoalteromonas shioyasakiensis]|uniref:SPOR domain-containing protein n=1 Tax=Pseudoalteromonas TaxID=53246 RepID=UPI000C98C68A|nr:MULTISPECIES: SPOR domain-containing protein [unclassified Pseudoalteromonas]MCG9708792.1 SPOR domain-containing protein [Pseudoalteromonas sp. Isolate3]MCQ8882304.1 SPOR domain-containing protein [Pseudoalteromonas shioyasakiensis]NIZ05309.1 SPOR domain-containing protein [Pseudoalteromonas sp. HF66]MAD04766.1 DedD protein [Pseudoalteromonas sp.]MCP4586109.1 SPOR domain-containing protein [Pseudoalteromonas sp.]